MQYQVIDWNSPGNYDLFWVIIGAILSGLLFADFIWIYYKFSKKDSESAPQEKTVYNQRKIPEHTCPVLLTGHRFKFQVFPCPSRDCCF